MRVKRTIRLRGTSPEVKGRTWESGELLRVGRLASLEIVLDDASVSRRHAELRNGADGWYVHDLESTNGTYLNGLQLDISEVPLRHLDSIQFGKVAFRVEFTDATPEPIPNEQQIVATTRSTFDEGIRGIAFNRNEKLRAGDQLVALLRAGQHFIQLQREDDVLKAVLDDAIKVLAAQRGAIVLAESDEPEPKLRLRKWADGPDEPPGRFHYSKNLTQRCFAGGVSLLYGTTSTDSESRLSQSITDGAMASVMCVLLRTPRKRLGVLHLDRNYNQDPFSEDDLYLADALAAYVSAAIESAQLLRQQREFFLKTITMLAQAVELRDDYTGGHTKRVTRYALMIAEQLDLPEDQLELLKLGGPLHDIGKIGINDSILRKPGKLTADEYTEMQTHTTKGADILRTIAEMQPIIPIVRNHHERWDGKGYPDRLAGEAIPFLARIVAVADAFDAMTSSRPYHENQKGKSPEWAFAEVEKNAGSQFDPRCVAAFLSVRDQVLRTMSESIHCSDGRDQSGGMIVKGASAVAHI